MRPTTGRPVTSAWSCVVQFPDGTRTTRETLGPAPLINTVWKIDGKDGLWRVTGHTLENYDCGISVAPVDPRHEHVGARLVFLAGVPVEDRLVLTLARRLRGAGLVATAERLETAYKRETKVLALDIRQREAILHVLEDGPDDFAELRGVLINEHVWRVREGLV